MALGGGDGPTSTGTLLTENYWQVANFGSDDQVTLNWEGTNIVSNVSSSDISGWPTTHTVGGYTYTRGDVSYSLGTTVTQYAMTRTIAGSGGSDSDGGSTGGGQSYWMEPPDYTNDGVRNIQVFWSGTKVIDNNFADNTTTIDLGEFTYVRGAQTSSSMSTTKIYNVTRQTEVAPVDLGDATTVGGATQSDYGIQILNSSGNEIWGGSHRVMSFVNETRSVTITIPANSTTATYELDLTEFGWTLTNRSVIDVYFRVPYINYTRTSNGVLITAQDQYGLSFDFDRTITYPYYLLRF